MKKKSFAVLGLGKFGRSVAIELAQAGAEVIAIDKDDEKTHEIAPYVTKAFKADICDLETMETLGLSNMDAVIIGITNNLDASVMGTIFCKEAGVPFVLSKAGSTVHSTILTKVGADRAFIPEKESGIRVARNLLSANLKEFVELSEKVRMVEIDVKPEWVGKTLRELDLRKTAHINVVGVRLENDEVELNLDPDKKITEGTSFIVVLNKHNLNKLMK